MAEASCSGATPFKRLVDHQSRNASHHQDRLVDRAGHAAHASFRSLAPAPAHDGGFGAFMDGSPASAADFPAAPPDAAGRLAVHAAALQPELGHRHVYASPAPAPDLSGWSAEFSRLSGPQQMRPAAQVTPQLQRPPASASAGLAFQPPVFARQPGPGFAPVFGRSAVVHAPPAESDFDREMASWMASHGGGNMVEVDAVMDQMARELEQNEAALPDLSTAAPAAAAQTTEPDARLTDLETPEIGNLSLRDLPEARPGEPAPEVPQDHEDVVARDKSAVSEAAERLLESVQHEHGDKWQNSVFLSLMRDFRDGRKDIVENEIRHTGDHAAAAAAESDALP